MCTFSISRSTIEAWTVEREFSTFYNFSCTRMLIQDVDGKMRVRHVDIFWYDRCDILWHLLIQIPSEIFNWILSIKWYRSAILIKTKDVSYGNFELNWKTVPSKLSRCTVKLTANTWTIYENKRLNEIFSVFHPIIFISWSINNCFAQRTNFLLNYIGIYISKLINRFDIIKKIQKKA